MHLIISPAKTLDFTTPAKTDQYSTPLFLDQSQTLIDQLKKLSPVEIAILMKLSDKLAALNTARFDSWQQPFTPQNAKQALLAFQGDVYTGLAADQFSEEDFAYAQQKLHILSGLYGLLKPLDLIQPYRLEMGTAFTNNKGKNLYQFWDGQLTEHLNDCLLIDKPESTEAVLVNLASNEYWKSIQPKKIKARIITPEFKDWKNGQYKIISFYAKKARGLMSAFIIKNRITAPEELKAFSSEGYYFSPEQSKGDQWCFLRDHDE